MKSLAIGNQVLLTVLQVEASQHFAKVMVLPQKFPSLVIKENQF